MYEVLVLTANQFNHFQRDLMEAADQVSPDARKGNYIMSDDQLPVTVAITQPLYPLLLELVPFLRECENLVVPRPDSIKDSGTWEVMFGDAGAFGTP